MTPTDLARIDLAANIQRLSIEEQLSRMRFAETRAELDAHRRLEADLTRALTILGHCVVVDPPPRPAIQPATLTDGRVSNLPASAAGECETRSATVTPKAGNSFASGNPIVAADSVRGQHGWTVANPLPCPLGDGLKKPCGDYARNPNSEVKQMFPRGRWT